MSTTFDNKMQEEILKRDGLGRLRTSQERREAILDDFEASAMSGVGYARTHGIKYTTFANWIQKRRQERGDYGKAEPPAKAPAMELALAEVVVKNPPPPGNRQGNTDVTRRFDIGWDFQIGSAALALRAHLRCVCLPRIRGVGCHWGIFPGFPL